MLRTVQRYKVTVAAALVAAFLWCLNLLTNIELFEWIIDVLGRLESYQVDEIVTGIFLVLAGVTIDLLSIKRERERREEIFQHRLRVLRSTMRTVMDIVGNFLNQLQLFHMQAERCKDFPSESVEMLNLMIHETGSRLKTLGNFQDTPERDIGAGLTVIDVTAGSSQRAPGSQRSHAPDEQNPLRG